MKKKESYEFVAVFDYEKDGINIRFPDLEEAISCASTTKEALKNANQTLDFAIDVDVPDESIVSRMAGRRACVGCGATYHIKYNAPKTEGVCDVCGKELILRDDDKAETVQKRLKVYHDQTQPLIDYYKEVGILRTVDGTQNMDDVFAAIVTILGA